MVKIRLAKTGRKNRPSYRIIAIDSRSKRDGRYLEKLGYFNPSEGADKPVYSKERYDYWISVGAQPTQTVIDLVTGKYKFIPYDRTSSADDLDSNTSDDAQNEPSTLDTGSVDTDNKVAHEKDATKSKDTKSGDKNKEGTDSEVVEK